MITLAWAAAALALLPLILAALNLRSFARPQARPPAGTAVSILIPARNEAKTIAETVRRALASVVVEVEVLVLDDDSTDDTAGIVSRLAERDARVRLLHAPPLSPGWAGKQRACHLLSEQARFETLMFIDADLLLAPDAAASAAGFLLADERRGLVSGFPREVSGELGGAARYPLDPRAVARLPADVPHAPLKLRLPSLRPVASGLWRGGRPTGKYAGMQPLPTPCTTASACRGCFARPAGAPTSSTAARSQAAACMKISARYGLASARAPAKAWRRPWRSRCGRC